MEIWRRIMAFKLGSEKRDIKSSENVSVHKKLVDNKPMEEGVLGQANNDGSIDLDPRIDPNSEQGQRIIKHEQCHLDQMESGRAGYGDNWVMWEKKIYIRKEEDGQNIIDGPNGKWPEGHPNHPWEAEAIEAETINKI